MSSPPPRLRRPANTFDVKLQIVPQPPIVSSAVPGNNATGVALDTNVLATFSKPMKAATISTSTFKLFDGAAEIPGAVTYDAPSQTATFDPTGSLDWNKTYTAVVYGDGGSGVQDDVPGEELYMLSNKVWSFTTLFAVYPTVLSSNPTINQFEVPRSSNVSVVFSKDMEGTSISDSTFTLFDGAAFVDGTVGYDPATRTATFDPDADLDWGKTYAATITTDVEDTDGLHLQNDRIWSFTTVMPVYPIVVSRTPVQGAIEVDIASNLTATFSKDIDPARSSTTPPASSSWTSTATTSTIPVRRRSLARTPPSRLPVSSRSIPTRTSTGTRPTR